MIELVPTFVLFFAVIDPIGSVPVFVAVTGGHGQAERRKIALKAIFVSALILVFFVAAGELILTAMDIPLAAFQTAGGIVLFLFALSMIFGESKPDEELKLASRGDDTAIFPLAVPSIAGPGAMLAAVLQTENAQFSVWEQAQTTVIILIVLSIALVLMLCASAVQRLLGDSCTSIVSRVMGLILASMAVSSVLSGIKEYFAL